MWLNEVDLLKVTTEVNAVGDVIEKAERNTVFCNEKSISQTEFYQAHANGLKPQIKIIVKAVDYDKERLVEYEGVRYSVLRTFKSNSEEIELVLEGDIFGDS